jgi:hypothetical protein
MGRVRRGRAEAEVAQRCDVEVGHGRAEVGTGRTADNGLERDASEASEARLRQKIAQRATPSPSFFF